MCQVEVDDRKSYTVKRRIRRGEDQQKRSGILSINEPEVFRITKGDRGLVARNIKVLDFLPAGLIRQ